MSVKDITLLSVSGTGMVASNSVLLTSSSSPVVLIKQKENVNAYAPEEKTISTSKSETKDYSRREINSNIYIHQDSEPKQYYLASNSLDLPKFFDLPFSASQDDYNSFLKENIKIKLFKNPAWKSSTKADEYESNPLAEDKVEELFKDLDELKTKQLLLSLSTRKEWKTYTDTGKDFWAGHNIIKPSSMDNLKDLKIKYFRDFDSLKSYIKEKVKVCTTEKRICVAQKEELTIIDQDELWFLDKTKISGDSSKDA